jgi:hypothetical protein
MSMNHHALIASLDRFRTILPAVIAGITTEDARWQPNESHWSILEILMHLCDEEIEDFRTRLRVTLEIPKHGMKPWPPIDPEGWAVARVYNDADFDHAVARFVKERKDSIDWLRSLDDADWSVAYQHPKFGPIRAGDLLAAWAAHDLLHLRQIAKRLYQIAQRDAEGFSTRYAGEW